MHSDMKDLRDRLSAAKHTLTGLALQAKSKSDYDTSHHLESKAEGVALALDYIRLYETTDSSDAQT